MASSRYNYSRFVSRESALQNWRLQKVPLLYGSISIKSSRPQNHDRRVFQNFPLHPTISSAYKFAPLFSVRTGRWTRSWWMGARGSAIYSTTTRKRGKNKKFRENFFVACSFTQHSDKAWGGLMLNGRRKLLFLIKTLRFEFPKVRDN